MTKRKQLLKISALTTMLIVGGGIYSAKAEEVSEHLMDPSTQISG